MKIRVESPKTKNKTKKKPKQNKKTNKQTKKNKNKKKKKTQQQQPNKTKQYFSFLENKTYYPSPFWQKIWKPVFKVKKQQNLSLLESETYCRLLSM